MLTIDLEEEFGYRNWIWKYPGTKERLLADWNAGKAPLNFFDPSAGEFSGELIHIEYEKRASYEPFAATGHVHWDDDTYLEIDGVRHPGIINHTFPGAAAIRESHLKNKLFEGETKLSIKLQQKRVDEK